MATSTSLKNCASESVVSIWRGTYAKMAVDNIAHDESLSHSLQMEVEIAELKDMNVVELMIPI